MRRTPGVDIRKGASRAACHADLYVVARGQIVSIEFKYPNAVGLQDVVGGAAQLTLQARHHSEALLVLYSGAGTGVLRVERQLRNIAAQDPRPRRRRRAGQRAPRGQRRRDRAPKPARGVRGPHAPAPTGIFYAQGVKANVIFFDRRPGAKEPWTKTVWVYDLRTNRHFTLKTKRMVRADLDEFVECYRPADRNRPQATWSDKTPEGRWRPYTYEEILARDKVSLDLFWLRDESLEAASLPEPHLLAQEIADDLRSALAQIEDVLGDLEQRAGAGAGEESPCVRMAASRPGAKNGERRTGGGRAGQSCSRRRGPGLWRVGAQTSR
jgi:hypothetical protein